MGGTHSSSGASTRARHVDVAPAGTNDVASASSGAGGAGAGSDTSSDVPSWAAAQKRRKPRGGTFGADELELIEKAFRELASKTPDTDTIAKEDFLEKFPLPGLMGERLFACIDRDNTGVIDKVNYLIAVRLLSKESNDGKIKLIFDMYDQNDDNAVSRDEMTRMLVDTAKSAFNIVCRFQPPESKEAADAMLKDMVDTAGVMVADAFDNFDTNEDGSLSLDQFRRWASNTPEVTHMLDSVMGAEGGRLLEVLEEPTGATPAAPKEKASLPDTDA